MRTLILRMHRHFYGLNNRTPGTLRHKNFALWVACNVLARLACMLLSADMWMRKVLCIYPPALSGEGEVVVSFTSFPKRIGSVWMVVDSLMRQAVRPASIQLYLSEEEFPEGLATLPSRLLNYTQLGLDIRLRPHNLMPHTKYFYALQEEDNADRLVVTVDDDLYYHPDMLGNLLRIYAEHPDCVCANSVKVMTCDAQGATLPYAQWEGAVSPVPPSVHNVALGFGGVLYPVALFAQTKGLFDEAAIRELCLKADDLWLRAQEAVYGIRVANGEYMCPGVSLMGSQAVSLMSTNTGALAENDKQWARLNERYGVDKLIWRM